MSVRVIAAYLIVTWSLAARAADYVWWEGEAALRTNFGKTWLSGSNLAKAEVLSGKDWLTWDGPVPATGAVATWRIEVPAKGVYHFWARKFWKHGPFQWHFDDRGSSHLRGGCGVGGFGRYSAVCGGQLGFAG